LYTKFKKVLYLYNYVRKPHEESKIVLVNGLTINRNGPVPDCSRSLSSCFWSGAVNSHTVTEVTTDITDTWHPLPNRLSWSRAYLAIFSVCACF